MNEKVKFYDDETLGKLHACQLEILNEIVAICERHHLRYFLIYGTLLGAVRHEGFIPWDDDMDVGMPREDYIKFIKYCRAELKEDFFLQDSESEPLYWLGFIKIRKNHTFFGEAWTDNEKFSQVHQGIYVDIFPFDHLKRNSGFLVHAHFVLIKAIHAVLAYKAGLLDSPRKMAYRFLSYPLLPLSLATVQKLEQRVAGVYAGRDDLKYLASFNEDGTYLKSISLQETFFPLKKMKFADGCYDVPNDPDAFLRQYYGDYMVLPAEEERYNHTASRISFTDEGEVYVAKVSV